ncbi:MAG: helix-turn-helix transcriptional regulator, partial [Proteobacteria bacterium]|nr:helix-turn-helix transcriptional regulator [Pseudomonadota bacterium]
MANNLNQLVGTRIQTLRKLRGYTQEQLAESIGKTVETISNIERGKKLPGLATLNDLGKALDVPLSELIEGGAKKKITPKREALLTKARELLNQLKDNELAISIQTMEALIDNR